MIRKSFCIACAFCLTAAVFSVDTSLTERYLNAAVKELDGQNYEKAFNYINFVLGAYKAEELPQNVEVIAETIYYSYLNEIKSVRNYAAFREVKEKLLEFPTVTSERVSRLVRTINTLESQDTAWGAPPPTQQQMPAQSAQGTDQQTSPGQSSPQGQQTVPAQPQGIIRPGSSAQPPAASQGVSAEDQQRVYQALSELLKNEQEQSSARQQELLDAQKQAYENVLNKSAEETKTVNATVVVAVVAGAAILIIVFAAVIINILVSLKNTKNQKDQFEETLKVVAQLTRSPRERMVLEGLPDIYNENGGPRIVGSSVLREGLPEPQMTDTEMAEVRELAAKCEKMGVEIDRVTGRKNNSKNVAEMVFKICHEMKLSQFDSMLYFSVAMVYDTGFLLVDQKLLQSDNLSEEDKYKIRSHVQLGLEQLDFVPERFRPTFIDGVLMHHENMDGSGYPEGLSGDQIPFIARLIHVVETFVSLVSKRSYRTIYDKESAMAELKNHPELYDQTIVTALDKQV